MLVQKKDCILMLFSLSRTDGQVQLCWCCSPGRWCPLLFEPDAGRAALPEPGLPSGNRGATQQGLCQRLKDMQVRIAAILLNISGIIQIQKGYRRQHATYEGIFRSTFSSVVLTWHFSLDTVGLKVDKSPPSPTTVTQTAPHNPLDLFSMPKRRRTVMTSTAFLNQVWNTQRTE